MHQHFGMIVNRLIKNSLKLHLQFLINGGKDDSEGEIHSLIPLCLFDYISCTIELEEGKKRTKGAFDCLNLEAIERNLLQILRQ